jgi:predicted site-specific integrase-resolvase
MELEELDPSKLHALQRDVETIESWAERNGIAYGIARAWAMKAIIPTIKVGKRRMVNSALLRSWLLEQEWTA